MKYLLFLTCIFCSQYAYPQKVDYSEDWRIVEDGWKSDDFIEGIKKFNLSKHLNSPQNDCVNGIIGKNYTRIQIYIDTVYQNPINALEYFVVGQSRVKENIVDFSGTIKIVKAVIRDGYNDSHNGLSVFADYIFKEDSIHQSSGVFKGALRSEYTMDAERTVLKFYPHTVQDGYINNTYVGTWTSNKSGAIIKCIWGLYRLPFTDDFDIGDGEMLVNSKYENNGWASFNNVTEYIYNEQTKRRERKDKWWK